MMITVAWRYNTRTIFIV